MKLVEKLVAASKKPLSSQGRLVTRIFPVLVFFFIFPSLLFLIPKFILDAWFQIDPIIPPIIRFVLGPGLIVLGVIFLVWTMMAQREIGRGTPMPLAATKVLVVHKPYSFCRNPLFFGLINFYFGISLLIDSASALGMVAIFSLVIIVYIKLIEEKELEIRFGSDYLAYKEKTAFIIPRRPQS